MELYYLKSEEKYMSDDSYRTNNEKTSKILTLLLEYGKKIEEKQDKA